MSCQFFRHRSLSKRPGPLSLELGRRHRMRKCLTRILPRPTSPNKPRPSSDGRRPRTSNSCNRRRIRWCNCLNTVCWASNCSPAFHHAQPAVIDGAIHKNSASPHRCLFGRQPPSVNSRRHFPPRRLSDRETVMDSAIHNVPTAPRSIDSGREAARVRLV